MRASKLESRGLALPAKSGASRPGLAREIAGVAGPAFGLAHEIWGLEARPCPRNLWSSGPALPAKLPALPTKMHALEAPLKAQGSALPAKLIKVLIII